MPWNWFFGLMSTKRIILLKVIEECQGYLGTCDISNWPPSQSFPYLGAGTPHPLKNGANVLLTFFPLSENVRKPQGSFIYQKG